jgi:hypothetical protein
LDDIRYCASLYKNLFATNYQSHLYIEEKVVLIFNVLEFAIGLIENCTRCNEKLANLKKQLQWMPLRDAQKDVS